MLRAAVGTRKQGVLGVGGQGADGALDDVEADPT